MERKDKIMSDMEDIREKISECIKEKNEYETQLKHLKCEIEKMDDKINAMERNLEKKKMELELEKDIVDLDIDYKLPLSDNDKTFIRNQIVEEISKLPEGKKIRVDITLLDELIFEKIRDDEGMAKIPIWTGAFLQKMILKDLSFDNVVYGLFDMVSVIDNGTNYKADFSYTDIVIDFSKAKILDIVTECNFEGVNLSKSNASVIKNAVHCNFSNTQIDLDLKNPDREITLLKCNLSNNYMAGVEIDSANLNLSGHKINIYKCNLVNTKIKINLAPIDFDYGEFRELHDTGVLHGCTAIYLGIPTIVDNFKADYMHPLGIINPTVIEFSMSDNKVIDGSKPKNTYGGKGSM